METTPSDKQGRSDLPSELGFALAPRETDPAPVVTRSSEVSRVEPTSTMVTRSCAREGRGISLIPETVRTGNRNAVGTGNTGFHANNL